MAMTQKEINRKFREKNRMVSAYVPIAFAEKVNAKAKELNMSQSDLIRVALSDFINKHQEGENMSKANQEIKSNDYTIPFTFTKFAADRKPQGKEVTKYQRINNYQTQNLTIEEVYERCATGYAWRAGVYKEGATGFSKRFVEGSYIIALDFDEVQHTPKEVYEYAVEIDLPPSFYYWSYSQDPKFDARKCKKSASSDIYIPNTQNICKNVHQNNRYKTGYNYRIVWVVDQMMTKQEYEGIVTALIEYVFADYDPDPATKDISRLWFGGLVGGGWKSQVQLQGLYKSLKYSFRVAFTFV